MESTKYGYTDILVLKGYILDKLNHPDAAKNIYRQSLVINRHQPDVEASIKQLTAQRSFIIENDKSLPEITLKSPAVTRSFEIVNDNQEVQIVGQATDAGGIGGVKVNGRSIKVEDDGLFVSTIPLKAGDNEVKIEATDKSGNTATKTFIIQSRLSSVNNQPVTTLSAAPANYYAIIIAAEKYNDPNIPTLKEPVNDAKDLMTILQSNYTFPAANIDTLFNKSRDEITAAVINRCRTLRENDNLLIFFAGHGTSIQDITQQPNGFLLPSSSVKSNFLTFLSDGDVDLILKTSRARHILFLADACFSGTLLRGLTDGTSFLPQQYDAYSRTAMTSGSLETVPDNSVFARELKAKLKENKQKLLPAHMLFESFKLQIIKEANTQPRYDHMKDVGDEGGDFIFVRRDN